MTFSFSFQRLLIFSVSQFSIFCLFSRKFIKIFISNSRNLLNVNTKSEKKQEKFEAAGTKVNAVAS